MELLEKQHLAPWFLWAFAVSGWSGGDHGSRTGGAAVAIWACPGWRNSHSNLMEFGNSLEG